MWQETDNQLVREYKFANFSEALAFVNRIGQLAETMNHHPDMELGWGRVKVMLTTHSEGGVTQKDRELARAIDNLG